MSLRGWALSSYTDLSFATRKSSSKIISVSPLPVLRHGKSGAQSGQCTIKHVPAEFCLCRTEFCLGTHTPSCWYLEKIIEVNTKKHRTIWNLCNSSHTRRTQRQNRVSSSWNCVAHSLWLLGPVFCTCSPHPPCSVPPFSRAPAAQCCRKSSHAAPSVGENLEVFDSPVLLFFSMENESQNLKSSNLQWNIIFLLFPICLKWHQVQILYYRWS